MNTIPQLQAHGQPKMPAAPAPNDTAWTTAVRKVSELAHAKLPEAMHGRLQRATALAINHNVWFEEDGEVCQVKGSKDGVWHVVNGHCDCTDYLYAPDGRCKHRCARWITLRAMEHLQAAGQADTKTPENLSPQPTASAIVDARFVMQINGKSFVLYNGLLACAHTQGLMSLTARFVSVTADLAIAEATAVFKDGRTFTEASEATPGNVAAKVRPHFARMALTRSKARALRDALNISLCAFEELGEDEKPDKTQEQIA